MPARPTPTPDPIAKLTPLKVISTRFLNVQSNDYDFVAKISNSNLDYGSGDVRYELKFLDPSSNAFYSKTGSFYILPGQTRYVIDAPVHLDRQVSKVEFQIKGVDWQKIDPLAAQGIDLVTRNVNYVPQGQPGLFAKAGGSVFNASQFDFENVAEI